MKKFGIRSVAKSTVRNILQEAGLDPCPKRAGSTWDEFLKQHAASFWQCDFLRTPVCAPNCQAYVERFIGSLRSECMNHFVFFGLKHLDSVAASFLEHYLGERPHQGKDNELLALPKGKQGKPSRKQQANETILSLRDVLCQQRLGGLLKHYSRKVV